MAHTAEGKDAELAETVNHQRCGATPLTVTGDIMERIDEADIDNTTGSWSSKERSDS